MSNEDRFALSALTGALGVLVVGLIGPVVYPDAPFSFAAGVVLAPYFLAGLAFIAGAK